MCNLPICILECDLLPISQAISISIPRLPKSEECYRRCVLRLKVWYDEVSVVGAIVAETMTDCWHKPLKEGKFESISELAREIGMDVSFAARLMRLTLLAPDIVEAILMGEEPSGLSLTTLTKQLPAVSEAQRLSLRIT